MSVTLGADPEFFLADVRTGGVIPACGLFGGEKGNAIPIPGLDVKGFGYQEDNVMLEFNIPPTTSPSIFAKHISSAMTRLRKFIQDKDASLVIDKESARLFRMDQLQHPKAREFGCSPDFNAYAQGAPFEPVNPAVLMEGEDAAWRFAGGHIHIGYDRKDVPDFVVAAFADVFIGLNLVPLDFQGYRRTYYGTPGRYRPTPYGIEYRTPSNFWLFNNHGLGAVAGGARRLGRWIERAPLGVIQKAYISIPWGDVAEAIRTESEEHALEITEEVMNHIGED